MTGSRDATGGWHDAGDYGRYSVNASFTNAQMLYAWEQRREALESLRLPIPESGGPLPDYLAEVKYNLDWLLKMQFEDGRVSHKISTIYFGSIEMTPEEDTDPTFFAPWDLLSTVDFAANGCIAARVYEEFDPEYAATWREAARKAWIAARGVEDFKVDLSAFHNGRYDQPSTRDYKWALMEVYLTFGPDFLTPDELAQFNAIFESEEQIFDLDWDWSNSINIGLYHCLFSKPGTIEARHMERLRQDIVAVADKLMAIHDAHAYGRAITRNRWGVNGSVARASFNLHAAWKVSGDKRYLDAAFDHLAYIYGRNPFARSFVTGDGPNPPMFPHHRPSAGDNVAAPWPGHLVGGPEKDELDWFDETGSFRTNEYAINWDGALVFALSLFYEP
jgi:endoglucanase